MKNLVLIVIAALFFTSCGVTVEQKEINDLVFGYDRGLMVGVEIGDSWEDVKANHREGWTIREEEDLYQFRKDWDEGNDMMYITFRLDEDKNVEDMEFSLTASKGNWVVMKTIEKKFVSDLNLITSSNSKEEWSYFGPNGNEYTIIYTPSVGDDKRMRFSVYTIKHV